MIGKRDGGRQGERESSSHLFLRKEVNTLGHLDQAVIEPGDTTTGREERRRVFPLRVLILLVWITEAIIFCQQGRFLSSLSTRSPALNVVSRRLEINLSLVLSLLMVFTSVSFFPPLNIPVVFS